MFSRLFKRKFNDLTGLFNGHFIEAKTLYAVEYNAVCCISFIGEIDTNKAFAFVNEAMKGDVYQTYQHSYFDHSEQRMLFNNTIFMLNSKRMIELGSNWCQVLHTPQQYTWANDVIKQFSQYKFANHEPVIGFARQAMT